MASVTASKVTTERVSGLYEAHVMKNYGPAPFAAVRGQGSYVWDAEGRRYLDFCSGIATNTLGHAHAHWVQAVQQQAGQLAHMSNLFYNEPQARLAQRLCERAGEGRAFFCNSGTEANEALIKLARLWGRQRAGGESGQIYKIVTAEKAFHGRTFGGMAATPQAKIQHGFEPMLPGFEHAEFNNVEAFADKIDDRTCAVMIETIQGESGVLPASVEFLQGLRQLCDERGVMLLIDEVQCGIGRSGHFFAYEEAGITPDAIGMAKGLGGGFPIGAIWARKGYDELFTPGSHGSTFGGNPLACAAANAVIDAIEQEDLLDKVQSQSAAFIQQLNDMVARHPEQLTGIRGRGYHLALVVQGDPLFWIARLREQGLLTVRGGADGIRLLPPLTASMRDLENGIEILDFVFGTTPTA
ncbi:MAG: acetylornithine/N-succinyldiaminopimelate aminotransferase [Puniceicoccaceae bacterium 5H]|nr:MAG: acetylornithine/N-succinyldiaminopimelate aminotransferase [Puniceicoccaceae bacterium 5H]